ncbi:efflux RND transporter periplasmic adaptor subunit [Oecophyllibacter saccharovorans]|uniref:HlyD family secretion protein n=1 Tax=Oecophyllibacter saccharovorans TaxID=2558360 RepID=A0A506ULN2_9PROT|nr:HlyD family secretion protein [Oecophyllibacter saccharovorans]QDH15398.1 HlyD family secretion protein [Oecophyllibacter saccharovorans]TPW34230.1 HlyD family secretion protein [Oecophyllibacter saccharovorans]TPW36417.1 HlyD family secretion protein [Oecophyllibacter saccharovorans]
MNWIARLIRPILTGLVLCIAIGLGYVVWGVYVLDPWTRDGRVRVYVVIAAPEVSGTVVAVPVVDNQFVHKGDPLYTLDPLRFQLAIDEARAKVAGTTDEYELAVANAKRRRGLHGVVSREEVDDYDSNVVNKRALMDTAKAELDTALLNLQRSTVYSSVDGYVTDLNLRVGDYATAGHPYISVVDASSFWMNAYFEETKLLGVKVGDKARIKLMGYPEILQGHVVSIGRGINDNNGVWDRLGLPDVSPIFTWVRLAQRIPVRVEFDNVPPEVLLSSGMTASVAVGPIQKGGNGILTTWLQTHL